MQLFLDCHDLDVHLARVVKDPQDKDYLWASSDGGTCSYYGTRGPMFYDIYCRCRGDAVWERLDPAFKSLTAPSGWSADKLETHALVSVAVAGAECAKPQYTAAPLACSPLEVTRTTERVGDGVGFKDPWLISRAPSTLGNVTPASCIVGPKTSALGYEENECLQQGSLIHRYASLGCQMTLGLMFFIFLFGWFIRTQVGMEAWFYSPAAAEESYFWMFIRRLGP